MDEKKNPHPCPFNSCVVCVVQLFCDHCGWNPDVAKERLHRITQDPNERRE